MHIIEQQLALFLPLFDPFFSAQSIDLPLNVKQCIETPNGFKRNGRYWPAIPLTIPGAFLNISQFKEFPSCMCMTKGECNRDLFHLRDRNRFKPVVAIRLQNAAVSGQMLLRVRAAPITRSIIDCRGRCTAIEWLIISHISPDASGCAFAFRPDGNGGVITVKSLSRKDMTFDQVEEWHQRGCSKPQLIRKRRGRQIHAFGFEPRALTVERNVHAKLVE